MKHGVSRRTLVFIAGLVWIIAGANILRIGIVTWLQEDLAWYCKLAGAIVVFALFFCFVFRRLFGKHIRRISRKGNSNCPFAFFDARGWIVMVFMIAAGVILRRFEWMPGWFIAMFYTGLSSALLLTGGLFLYRWKKA